MHNQCTFQQIFADGSSARGMAATDRVWVGGVVVEAPIGVVTEASAQFQSNGVTGYGRLLRECIRGRGTPD